MSKPKFDPTKPFSAEPVSKPKFDPTKPYDMAPKVQEKQGYDYSNVGQVASDLGSQAVKGLRQVPEMLGSTFGEAVAGPLGSGVGGAIGQSVSEAGEGIVNAVKDPAQFVKDLSQQNNLSKLTLSAWSTNKTECFNIF
jgi:hypothetical protein